MKRKRFAQGICGGVWPDAYFESIPPGWRFRPTKRHLLQYLKAKILNKPLPGNRIPEVDLYAHHPQDLVGMYKLIRETEWYFFSPRNRKYPNGSRPDRAAGRGFWKATGKELEIKVDDKIIGYQNSLDFYEGKNPNDRTDWKMHELRMTNDIAPPIKIGAQGMKLNDWVLCKVYENSRKAKKRDEEEEEPQYDGGMQIADMMRELPLHQSYTSTNQVLCKPYSDVGMVEEEEPQYNYGGVQKDDMTREPPLHQSYTFTNQVLCKPYSDVGMVEEEEPEYNYGGVQIDDMMREPPLQQSYAFTNQVLRMPYSDVGMVEKEEPQYNGGVQIAGMMREPPLQQSYTFTNQALCMPYSDVGMGYMSSMNGNLQPPLMQSSSFGMPPLLQAPLITQSPSFGMPPLLQAPLITQSSSFGMPPLLQASQNGTLEDIAFEFRFKEKKDDDVAVQLSEDGGKVADDKDDAAVQLPEDCCTVAEDEDVVTVPRPDKGDKWAQKYEEWLRQLKDTMTY